EAADANLPQERIARGHVAPAEGVEIDLDRRLGRLGVDVGHRSADLHVAAEDFAATAERQGDPGLQTTQGHPQAVPQNASAEERPAPRVQEGCMSLSDADLRERLPRAADLPQIRGD